MMVVRTHSPSGLGAVVVGWGCEENQEEEALLFVPAIACDQFDKE
jgi:hypothetical protein